MSKALTLFSCVLLFLAAPSDTSIGRIENSAGAAVLLRGDKVLAPVPRTPLQAGDIVRTEKGGLVRVILTDGSSLSASENTEFRVTKHDTATQQTTIELLRGHLLSQNTPVTQSGGRFQILTPTALVVALGTTLDVQTAEPPSVLPGETLLQVQDNGRALSGADVALVLANMNKVALGKTDDQGTPNPALELANDTGTTPALELANLGKVPLHAEIDECEDGAKRVYLVGPDGKLPPQAKNCRRKRLEGMFFWGKAQRIALDLALGNVVVSDLPPPTAGSTVTQRFGSAPKSLTEIPPISETVPGPAPNLTSYAPVGATIVTALDHFVGVANIDPKTHGAVYLLPGEGTMVGRSQVPTQPIGITDGDSWRNTRQRNWPNDSNLSAPGEGSRTQDFDVNGRACTPGWVVNGVAAPGTTPSFRYVIKGLGTSTGNALQLEVFNEGACPLYFLVTDGTILHPKGFTERVITGIILGGVPSLKDFQKMISMGGFLRVAPVGALAAGPAVPVGGEASMPLRSFCVELHKLAPHPKTEYKIGDASDQAGLGANRAIVDRVFSHVQTGQLRLPPSHGLDSVIQWSLWTKIEGMDEKKFHEEFTKLVHKNYEAQKKKWDKNAELQTEEASRSLWTAVSEVLR